MTYEEITPILKISKRTIQRYIRDGLLRPSVHYWRIKRRVYFDLPAIEQTARVAFFYGLE